MFLSFLYRMINKKVAFIHMKEKTDADNLKSTVELSIEYSAKNQL